MDVLVVDDGADVVAPVRMVAATTAGALDQARTHLRTLAILDAHLPDGSGLDLLAAVRKRDPTLCVIMLASAGNEAERGAHEACMGSAWNLAEVVGESRKVADIVAHDLNDLLTVMLNYPRPTAEPESSDGATSSYAREVASASERASVLARQRRTAVHGALATDAGFAARAAA